MVSIGVVGLGILGLMAADPAFTAAQDGGEANELDRFMEQVLARRDENRIARRQLVFDETEQFTVTGYDGEIYRTFTREYIWYRRDGVLVRSPVRIDGVTPSEVDWRRYEADWLEAEARRAPNALAAAETPCASDGSSEPPTAGEGGEVDPPPSLGATERDDEPSNLTAAADLRPRFLSESYWLDFEFEPGNYYFAGRERLAGREVLRIEYFPERLFDTRDSDDAECERPAIMVPGAQDEFNKGALVTLWIDPAEQQIVRFTFDNIGFDFLPLRWLIRLDGLTASMTMGRPLDDVWLPERIDASGVMTMASGSTTVAYSRFETIEVRRLYRSLTATNRVALVIVVRERPGARFSNPVVRALAGLGRRLMVAPMVEHEEGYGVAYGALTSVVDPLGAGSRLSVPATWGGHKRIALEMEAPIRGTVIDRLRAGGSRGRRRHPYFDVDDDRTRFEVAIERRLPHRFRVNGEAAWEDIRFSARTDRLIRSAVHLDYGDYRLTPATARRNTVVVRAGIERLAIAGGGGTVIRPRLDARAYAAAGGQAVLAGRLFFEGASAPLPAYERALLGGSPAAGGTLRGWPAGVAVGDRIAAASISSQVRVTGSIPSNRLAISRQARATSSDPSSASSSRAAATPVNLDGRR